MKIIGITGPSGSGKTLLGQLLRKKGINVIDADKLYHSMLTPPSKCLDLIRDAFGDAVFCADGTLDRKALGKIVFEDKEKLDLLNSTVLSVVIDEIWARISDFERAGAAVVAVDAPTLIESGFNADCDCVISVIASPEVRLDRIIARDSLDRAAAKRRIEAQKDNEFYILHSDFVITNNSSAEDFSEQAEKIFKTII